MEGGFLSARTVPGLVERRGVQASPPPARSSAARPHPRPVTLEQGCCSCLWPTHHAPASRPCTASSWLGPGFPQLSQRAATCLHTGRDVGGRSVLAQCLLGSQFLGSGEAVPHVREVGEAQGGWGGSVAPDGLPASCRFWALQSSRGTGRDRTEVGVKRLSGVRS